ncbi:hypothetical protein [Polaribacter sp. Hel1_85]|uniref:hypothetical protein n=1 Tax=Polaribacter sp. Hel1_85 TaxID=1250005 RepID=UPI00052C8B98|nr:hypothetical protein [Polaribacter sp. Hel1_85]KGL62259.1 hypothetical protein PHEL85_2050 [Polaribacter sp. Hel1_85]
MIYTSHLIYTVFFLLIFFNYQTVFSQGIAQTIIAKPSTKSYAIYNKVVVENGILEDGKYTYDFKEKKVLVEIKDGYYYEYHSEKEYIKAKIDWLTEYKYKLTIVDLEKRGVPLKIGSKLTSRIVKVQGNEYFYSCILNNKTRIGSFKKVK